MYFVKLYGGVFHILDDINTGRAPEPCGATLESFITEGYLAGKPTTQITVEKPSHVPFCRHCQKAKTLSRDED
ncbi:MAG TPA: hypothetical protein VGC91_21025 [Pyrinomonadaceae bacterium]|jgi:hypothetical protein